jgi:archaellum component FlaC
MYEEKMPYNAVSTSGEDLKRTGQVPNELRHLDKAIAELETVLSGLSSRIHPIVRPMTESNEKPSKPEPQLVPIAEQIRQQRKKIERLSRDVRDVIDLIEL